MKRLTGKQMREIGAAFVLEQLNPVTPYGRDAARDIAPFPASGADCLEACLDNVFRVTSSMELGEWDIVLRILSAFKDIRGSVRKLGGASRALGDVELFEVKSFLLALGELAWVYMRIDKELRLVGIHITAMDAALNILDPDGTRLRSFHISESYSIKLKLIREKKRDLDNRMNCSSCTADFQELERERLDVAAEEEEEELVVRTELTSKLSPYKSLFVANIENIAKLDLVIAKAIMAREYGCVKPVITESSIVIKNAYSPEISAALKNRGGRITPVSMSLYSGTAVLTGANMGGKSVALKTLALNAYLFQCGFLAFADVAQFPLFDYLDFIFDDEQSVFSGLSSFGAEMVRISEFINHAENGFSLIILDEPARGTNPREGRAIAAGLAEYLNALPSISILSTHYDNVAKENYNCYMSAGLKKDKLAVTKKLSPEMIPELMDYRLVKTPQSNKVANDALNICRLLEVNPVLLEIVEKEL